MKRSTRGFWSGLGVATICSLMATQFTAASPLERQLVVGSLHRPCYVTAPPGDTSRIFIIEQRDGVTNSPPATGRIRIVTLPNTLVAASYITVSVSAGDEQGLLGLAFDPNYMTNGVFFINYTNTSGDTRVEKWIDSNPADNVFTAAPGSGALVLFLDQPFSNHNGGWMAFGPDGYLYIPTGDGGAACDPSERAQNLNLLFGKTLRIDPDGPDNMYGTADDDAFPADPNKNYAIPPTNPFVGVAGEDEIFHYGLRNPWRPSFDRLTGDFYIADVGQGLREEVNYRTGGSAGGTNFGWDCYEGTACFSGTAATCGGTADGNGCPCNGVPTPPIYEYLHSGGACSITGGYVYRGPAMPSLQGTYFLADYCTGTVTTFRVVGGLATEVTNRTSDINPSGMGTATGITSFGQDDAGEMYMCVRGGNGTQTGAVWKLITVESDPPTPNPMTFATLPTPASISVINMVATTATDASTPVTYQFQETTGGPGATSSGFQTSTTHSDSGLTANTLYTYMVRASDGINIGGYSNPASTATLIQAPIGLNSGVITSNSIELIAQGTFTNLAVGMSGLYFDCTDSGCNTGLNVWSQNTTATATGLTPNTLYNFTVKARNQLGVETAVAGGAFMTLPAGGCPLLGDVNGDTTVDGEDIAGFTRVKLGTPEPGDVAACANYGTGTLETDIAAFVDDLING